MSLAQAAMIAPDYSSETKFFASHPVTCHMAAMYWAFRTNGQSAKDATSTLKAITKSLCAGCKTKGMNHGSLGQPNYGRLFCGAAHPMDALCMVGDVVILPDPRFPMHSMVIVGKGMGNQILVRGFNNTNTFPNGNPPAPYMAYDNTTRDLATRVSPITNAAFYIRSTTYLRSALKACLDIKAGKAL